MKKYSPKENRTRIQNNNKTNSTTIKWDNYRSKYVTQVQQQRPEPPTVTLSWHACNYKVHKHLQRYIQLDVSAESPFSWIKPLSKRRSVFCLFSFCFVCLFVCLLSVCLSVGRSVGRSVSVPVPVCLCPSALASVSLDPSIPTLTHSLWSSHKKRLTQEHLPCYILSPSVASPASPTTSTRRRRRHGCTTRWPTASCSYGTTSSPWTRRPKRRTRPERPTAVSTCCSLLSCWQYLKVCWDVCVCWGEEGGGGSCVCMCACACVCVCVCERVWEGVVCVCMCVCVCLFVDLFFPSLSVIRMSE